jgi:5-formaminoimidazole-4-carboxamide-1-(beta)-D-ribofuranosyl 5'-monophosphate synthetase
MNPTNLLRGYDTKNLTIAALGGHSALDVLHGAKKYGFRTLAVTQKGREKTYNRYFKIHGTKGCIDETINLPKFEDVLQKDIQDKLRKLNIIFVQSRYFWVYFKDYAAIENDFHVPMFGNRGYVKIEERTSTSLSTGNQEFNQYDLLKSAGIRTPKIFEKPEDINRLCIVKAVEAKRGYERAFFLAHDKASWEEKGSKLEKEGLVNAHWREAVIEEYIVGAPVNFNFFYSPLSKELELMGTDMRRQTNLDGFLRMTAEQQKQAVQHVDLKMIETGHIAVTVKESLLEKAFELGEKFVKATKEIDTKGIIGPFALQGAVVAEEGKEDIVIFDVSLRIPGSPGTRFTPYTDYLHGESMSCGERIAMEIREAVKEGRLEEVVT